MCDEELGSERASLPKDAQSSSAVAPLLSSNGLCERCSAELSKNNQHICNKCGRIQQNEADFCLTCQNFERHFDSARSPYVFEGAAQSLVHSLKFGNKKYYAPYMAKAMVDCYLDNEFMCDLILPVPLSKERKRKRGYNQAELLAKQIAYFLKLPMDNKNLIKVVNNPEQARKSGKERELNVLNAYKVTKPQELDGKRILIVDDVLTTGATTSEVAKILYKAKAKSVYVLTYASTRYKINTDANNDISQIENNFDKSNAECNSDILNAESMSNISKEESNFDKSNAERLDKTIKK